MHDQPKYEPLEASTIFADGASSRTPVEETVARGQLRADPVFFTGRTPDDQFTTVLPLELDQALLERGRNRYEAFCTPCHGYLGNGRGMIVQRGFKQPESFHQERLRSSPIGYFYNAMTNGFGQMSSYASLLTPRDRWAVAAYVRALQLRSAVPVTALSEDERRLLAGGPEAAADEPEDRSPDHD